MKTNILFIITALFYLSFSSDAHSAAAAAATEKESDESQVFKTTLLPGGLTQLDMIAPSESNCFSLYYNHGFHFRVRNTDDARGKSLLRKICEDAVLFESPIINAGSGIYSKRAEEIEDIESIYKAGQLIEFKCRKISLQQTILIWKKGLGNHCMFSALKGCRFLIRGVELIGKTIDSRGNFVAIVNGRTNFNTDSFSEVFSGSGHPIPGTFSEFTVLECAGIRLIIESPTD